MARKKKVQVWIYGWDEATEDWRVLILKTNRARGSFWQPVTGGVDPGERILEAAKRETREETGLRLATLPQRLGASFDFEGRFGPAREFGFAVRAARLGPPRLDSKEHVAFEWSLIRNAARKIAYSSNVRLLRLLEKQLKKT